MSRPRVVILGAGPAGVGAAFALTRKRNFEVTVLEQRGVAGGNAGSFELDGLRVDYGSHRLHQSCDPKILEDLRELLGDDLLAPPRRGRIRLQGRWIRFPLRAADLALRLPKSFASRAVWDALSSPLRRAPKVQSFASVLERGLGPTICRDFYFPYARKIWGLEPEQLSAVQAHRRVSASSATKLLGRLVRGPSRFYYPRRGYGQISEAMAEASKTLGAKTLYGATVSAIEAENGRAHRVHFSRGSESHQVDADHVWSTLPVPSAARLVSPQAPREVLAAADSLRFRAMILVYVTLETPQFSPWDAHYFPEESVRITRISEPKNYSGASEPADRTVLCAELPCATDDAAWSMSDEELKTAVLGDLAGAGLRVEARVANIVTKRLKFAYPIYTAGFEEAFRAVDNWLGSLGGLVTFGRQGLFAHDNTHHALAMAYAAVDCIDEAASFDSTRWAMWRGVFESYVVED